MTARKLLLCIATVSVGLVSIGAACNQSAPQIASEGSGAVTIADGICQEIASVTGPSDPAWVTLVCALLGADGKPLPGADGGQKTIRVNLPRATWLAAKARDAGK